MRLSFVTSQQANSYHFVQNLSAWHQSYRPEYNQYWREILDLDQDENNALTDFTTVRKKFPAGKSIFENAFFNQKNPWPELKRSLSSEDYLKVKACFDTYAPKFTQIYSSDESNLQIWQEKLQNLEHDDKRRDSIISELSGLYDEQIIKPATVKVYLLLCSPSRIGGGANVDGSSITLEVSQMTAGQANIDLAMSIIWHEIIHLLFDKKYFQKLLEKIYVDTPELQNKARELTASLLFPYGILGTKYYDLELADDPCHQIAYQLLERYSQANRKLDAEFVKAVMNLHGLTPVVSS